MKTRSFFLLLLILLSLELEAGIEKYFNKAPNKGANSMANIDFIYVINLDERPEKFKATADQLGKFGIHPYRFSGVNGWRLTASDLNEVGLRLDASMKKGQMGTVHREDGGKIYFSHELIEQEGVTYFAHCLSKGAIGIVLSHLSVLQDAYDSGYQRIWVMEDDIEVNRDPRELSMLVVKLSHLVPDWDILFTNVDIKDANGQYVPCRGLIGRPNFNCLPDAEYNKKHKIISRDFMQIGRRYGAQSMIVSRSGMKKLLDFIKTHKVFLPYDIDYFLPPGIKLFCTRWDIVSNQEKSLSDNGAPGYLENQKKK